MGGCLDFVHTPERYRIRKFYFLQKGLALRIPDSIRSHFLAGSNYPFTDSCLVHTQVLDTSKQTGQAIDFAVSGTILFSGSALAPVIWYTSFSFCDAAKQDLGPVGNHIQGFNYFESAGIPRQCTCFRRLGVLLKKQGIR